jgi:hypothetical protein
MGEIINNGQTIFGTTVRFIWKRSANISGIKSNTSVELDSTGFGTLCLDCDRAHGLQVKLDGQSGIKYPSS